MAPEWQWQQSGNECIHVLGSDDVLGSHDVLVHIVMCCCSNFETDLVGFDVPHLFSYSIVLSNK